MTSPFPDARASDSCSPRATSSPQDRATDPAHADDAHYVDRGPWESSKLIRPLNATVTNPEVTAPFASVEVDRRKDVRAGLRVNDAPAWLPARRQAHRQPVPGPTGTLEHQPLWILRRADNRELVARQALGQLGLRGVALDPIQPRGGYTPTSPPIGDPSPHDQPIPSGGSRSARPRTSGSTQKCAPTGAPAKRLTSRRGGRIRISEEGVSSP